MTEFQFDAPVEGDEYNVLASYVEIENEETFHMKNLYKMIHDWLDEEGFKSIYDDANPEVFYLERMLGTGSKEHRIWWRCLRSPKDSKYYRYFLKVDFMTLNMKSIEVMHQGHKMKTDRGDVIIKIWAYIQLDYKKEWRKNSFLKKVDRWFRERLYKAQVESYKIDLYKTTYRLQNIIKQYLKLKTVYEMPKPFHPEKGI